MKNNFLVRPVENECNEGRNVNRSDTRGEQAKHRSKRRWNYPGGEYSKGYYRRRGGPFTVHHSLFTFLLKTIIAIFLVLVLKTPGYALSSTNIWIGNALYADVESWAAEGLIESQLSSMKPMARSELGRQLVTALDRCNTSQAPSINCVNIQQYYKKVYDAELSEARNASSVSGSFIKPVENVSFSFNYLDGPFSIYNNEGIDFGEGSNALVQLQSSARLWKAFSFFVQPVLIYNHHAYTSGDDSETKLRLHRGYAKVNLFNFEIQAGRDSLWWGPGYHGSLLLSNNAKPFDMIKLSNPEPVLLPWFFSYLGPFQFNLIFSQLHDERTGIELANPFLYGLRFDFKPHPYLEVGLSHLSMFGGPGRRDLSIGDVLKVLYSNTNPDPSEKLDSNAQVALDLALTLPNVKKYIFIADALKLYTEWGAEDTGFPPDKRAYIGGLALFKPFGLERAVLRGEYARMSPGSLPGAWYSHPTYPMRYNGRVFGHHAGNDSDDIFVEWSQTFDKFSYKLSFDRERSGIGTKSFVQTKNQYLGEVGYRFNNNIKVALQYGYENIKNAGNVQDVNEKNHFFGTIVSFDF